jgi:hypothetical protein
VPAATTPAQPATDPAVPAAAWLGVERVETLQAVGIDAAVFLRNAVAAPQVEAATVATLVWASPVTLENVELPRFEGLGLSDFLRTGDSIEVQRRFEDIKRQLRLPALEHQDRVSIMTGATSAFTVGYVIWLLRGGVLLSSVLSALPAWHLIDPLPVLGRAGPRDDDEDQDDEAVARLFQGRRRASAAAVPADATQPTTEPG